jgi:WD40 repeat protein
MAGAFDLATCDSRGLVAFWDTWSNVEMQRLSVPHNLCHIAISPDCKHIGTARERFIDIWDVASAQRIISLELGEDTVGEVNSIQFSPDGALLASGSDDRYVRLWNTTTWKIVSSMWGHTAMILSVAFSPNSAMIASAGHDKTIRLKRVTGELGIGLDYSTASVLKGHTQAISQVVFAPDGAVIASSSWDKTVRLWDVSSLVCTAILIGHVRRVAGVAYSPDGCLLASCSNDGSVRLWRVADQTCISTLAGHIGSVISIAFSPSGRMLATGGMDKRVRLWSVVRQCCTATLAGHADHVVCVAFRPPQSRAGALVRCVGSGSFCVLISFCAQGGWSRTTHRLSASVGVRAAVQQVMRGVWAERHRLPSQLQLQAQPQLCALPDDVLDLIFESLDG